VTSGADVGPLFRVGITGHRDLATRYAAKQGAIRDALAAALAQIRNIARAAAPASGDKRTQPSLRLISPLAEGADRLAAEIASELGYRLLVALPFEQATYEEDFDAASQAEFRQIMARAGVEDGVVVLGGRRAAADASYLAVGRFVVENVDLLIAVWDRERPALPGGTGDVVDVALEHGVPIVWIPPDAPEPAWLLDALPNAKAPRRFVDATDTLEDYAIRCFTAANREIVLRGGRR